MLLGLIVTIVVVAVVVALIVYGVTKYMNNKKKSKRHHDSETPRTQARVAEATAPRSLTAAAQSTMERMQQGVPSGPMAYDGAATPGTGLDGLQDTSVPSRPTAHVKSLQIVPRSTQTSVDYWNDAWSFRYPDRGQVSFNVRKDSGLIVSLADEPGYPKVGYAVTIDKRGGVMTNFSDTTTSMTYVSRLPVMDAPINSSSMVRNVELDSDATHHVRITYEHGYIEIYVDGLRVLAASDPMPTPGVQFVGFGCTGLQSGVGLLTDVQIA